MTVDGKGKGPHQGTQPILRQPAKMGRDATPNVEAPAGRALRGPGKPNPTSYAKSRRDRAPISPPVVLDSDSDYLADVD